MDSRDTGQHLARKHRAPPQSFSEMPSLSHRDFLTYVKSALLIQLDLVALAFHSSTRQTEAGG